MEFTANSVVRWISNVTELGLEFASRRYYGLYGATVESNDDRRQQGRVSARIGVLAIGTTDAAKVFTPDVHPEMLMPMSIYAGVEHGIYFPPEDGDSIYVSFDHGDGQAPRQVGSFWSNPNASKAASTSHLPTEFKAKKGKGIPLKRGIKTGFGHGLIFCDDPEEPYVAIWSGEQLGKDDKGRPKQGEARRSQQITLSDTTAAPTVRDETVEEGIYADTIYGHRIALNDTSKYIMISGLRADVDGINANSIKIEDIPGKVTVKTAGPAGLAHTIDLDNKTGLITIQSRVGPTQSVVIDSNTGNINVTATGALTMSAAGGIAMGSGAAPPAPSGPGVAVETGVGAKIINFVGAVTETLGSFAQTAATVAITATTSMLITTPSLIINSGIFNVPAAAVSLGPPGTGIVLFGGLVTIGNPATARNLANDLLVDFVLNHEHPLGDSGSPTGIPTPGPISTLAPGFVGNALPPITLAQYASIMKST